MARYLDKDQNEIEAFQLAEDLEGNYQGKKGDWIMVMPDGKKVITDPAYFTATYKQKYPKAAD